MNIHNDITSLVGNTPLVFLNKVNQRGHAKIAVKLEFYSPASSVKDRLALAMITAAEFDGLIDKEFYRFYKKYLECHYHDAHQYRQPKLSFLFHSATCMQLQCC